MKRFLAILGLSLAAGLLLFSLQAQAVNKWVDSNGRVHYSDTPPVEIDTETLRSSGGQDNANAPASNKAPTSTAAPKSVAEREADLRKAKQSKEDETQKSSQKEADADAKKKNCDSARENLRTLESGTRITSVDANGERVFMEDDAIQQRIGEARKIAEQNCN